VRTIKGSTELFYFAKYTFPNPAKGVSWPRRRKLRDYGT